MARDLAESRVGAIRTRGGAVYILTNEGRFVLPTPGPFIEEMKKRGYAVIPIEEAREWEVMNPRIGAGIEPLRHP